MLPAVLVLSLALTKKYQPVIDDAKVELVNSYVANLLCLSAAGRNMPTGPLTYFVWKQSRRFAEKPSATCTKNLSWNH